MNLCKFLVDPGFGGRLTESRSRAMDASDATITGAADARPATKRCVREVRRDSQNVYLCLQQVKKKATTILLCMLFSWCLGV